MTDIRQMIMLNIVDGNKFLDLYNYNETTGVFEIEKSLNPAEPEDGTLAGEVVCSDGSTIHTLRYNKMLHDYFETGEVCPEPVEPDYDFKVENNVVTKKDGSVAYTGTNFTTALQWACKQVEQISYIPKCSQNVVSPVQMYNGVHIIGDGNGVEGTLLNFTYLGSNGKGRGFYANNVNDTVVESLKVGGHGTIEWWASNGSTFSGHTIKDVLFNVSNKAPWGLGTWVSGKSVIQDVSIENCKAIDCGCIGFGFFGDKANIPEPSDTGCRKTGGWIKNATFINCEATRCGIASPRYNDYVVGYDLAEGVNVENIVLDNCKADNNWMNGYHLEQWPYTKQVKFVNSQANYNGTVRPGGGWGWMCRNETGVHETLFEGNTVGVGNQSGKIACASI